MEAELLSGPAGADAVESRYQSLLKVTDLVALHPCVDRFLPALASCLSEVAVFDAIILVLAWDGIDSALFYHVTVCPSDGQPLGFRLEKEPLPLVLRAPVEALWASQPPRTLHSLVDGGEHPALIEEMQRRGATSGCLLPLVTSVRRVGLMGFVSSRPCAYDESDLVFLERVASQSATAIDNVRHHEEAINHQRQAEAERDRWRALLEINNALVTNLDLASLLATITPSLREIVPHDSTSIALLHSEGERVGSLALDPDLPACVEEFLSSVETKDTPVALALALRKPLDLSSADVGVIPESWKKRLGSFFLQRMCFVPLFTARRDLGGLLLGRRRPDPFSEDQQIRVFQAAGQIAIALENALAFGEIAQLKDRLVEENLYLESEIRGAHDFEEIIGESAALQHVLAQARSVAATDSAVLLLGETGTGKELVARAIHAMSERRSSSLVAVNCTTSPAGLIESEWFGYERGAFTGALTRKLGRFELAHHGTLFLDEIGDIPLDLQGKLLRVLQEHQIERLGGTRTIPVDFRLVAATNRDLEAMVARREYRSDLYYRLNVFPIRIPPLCERREDIPPLVRYFVQRYATRLRRNIDSIPRQTMDALTNWKWPGNVRELQNVIERAVILSDGRTLQVPRSEFQQTVITGSQTARTLEEVDREHILRTLDETGWVIGGPRGAARRLALNRTTLMSTMRRLGITRPKLTNTR
jgi:formate hydrogenlyase transcriptional activator